MTTPTTAAHIQAVAETPEAKACQGLAPLLLERMERATPTPTASRTLPRVKLSIEEIEKITNLLNTLA